MELVKKPPPLRVVFMGTPDFALPALKALHENPDVARIVAVYTQPDRPAGRGQKLTSPPVKNLATEYGYPIFQPENINVPEERKRLADLVADVYVVVAYAQFLSAGILNLPRIFCVNIHSSLLPKYRGAAPIQYAIWKGEKISGVSTMKLVPKMDAGPVLEQESVPITENMNAKELHDILSEMGGKLIVQTLQKLLDRSYEEKPQDEALVTFAPMLKKTDGLIDWNITGIQILRQINAFYPWPGTFSRSNKGTIKIHRAKYHATVAHSPFHALPGEIFLQSEHLYIKCKDGWIEPLEVQPEGKASISTKDFINGIKNNPSFKFETTA